MLKIHLDSGGIYQGSTVRGRVVATLERPTSCREIIVALMSTGRFLTVREDNGIGTFPTTYTDEQILWRPETGTSDVFPEGEHSFSFQFKLPPIKIIASEIPMTHTISACMKLSRFKSHLATTTFAVQERTDLESAGAESQTVHKIKYLAFNSGSISLSVSIPRTAYSSRESVPHTVTIDNKTSKTVCIRSKLLSYMYIPNRRPTILHQIQHEVHSQPIAPGEKGTHEMCVYLPVQTPRNFFQHYILQVTVAIPWRLNMSVMLPLIYKRDLNLLQASVGISPTALAQMHQQAAQYLLNNGMAPQSGAPSMPPHTGMAPYGVPTAMFPQASQYSQHSGMPLLGEAAPYGGIPTTRERSICCLDNHPQLLLKWPNKSPLWMILRLLNKPHPLLGF